MREFMKKRAKELGLHDIRVNSAGCLERCELGPTMVIYPEGIWYHYESVEDVEEILQSHVLEDKPVSRLLLTDGQLFPKTIEFLRLRLKVTAIDSATADTLRIEFRNAEGAELPPFTAGAHIDLVIGDGDMRRSYSLINNPSERRQYVIGVLKDRQSRGGSDWVHDQLRPDDVIQSGYPKNNFQLVEAATSHLLIAGGIGIAPILAMCYRLRTLGANFFVHYCAESEEQAAFVEELHDICKHRIEVHYDGGNPEFGINLDKVLASYSEGAQLYVCGPTGLMDDVKLKASHWPTESIHSELFRRKLPTVWKNSEFDVVLARHKKTIHVRADQSILEALKSAEVTTDFSCTEGLCGACRTKVLHGKVEHRDTILSDQEKSDNDLMMVCISRAAAGERQLILDI